MAFKNIQLTILSTFLLFLFLIRIKEEAFIEQSRLIHQSIDRLSKDKNTSKCHHTLWDKRFNQLTSQLTKSQEGSYPDRFLFYCVLFCSGIILMFSFSCLRQIPQDVVVDLSVILNIIRISLVLSAPRLCCGLFIFRLMTFLGSFLFAIL